MKNLYRLITTLLFAVVLMNVSAFSQDKLYVLFDDIDYVYNKDGTIISNGFDELYFKPLLTNNMFTENLLKIGYANFFNSGKKLTDFEVAVFFLGNRPLQYDAGTGHKIVKEIKNMLNAGKRVILIGNVLLYAAFHPQSAYRDPEVQQFFEDYLGITQNAYLPLVTTNGSTYTPFGLKAPQNNPVGKGYQKVCNYAQGPGTCSPSELHPWRYTTYIDAILRKNLKKTTEGNSAEAMELFTWVSDWWNTSSISYSDTLAGLNVQNPSTDPVQDSKLIYWSTGFEIASGCGSIPNWTTELWYAMIWCTSDLPKPGPNIAFSTDPLDFKTVALEDSSVKTVTITNVGRETLEVYDLYDEDFVDKNVFRVLTKTKSFDLKPGESQDIEIGFYPNEQIFYKEYFTVESNAANGKTLGIELEGYGGKKPEAGPKLAVRSTTLNYGTIGPGESKDLNIVLLNPGTAPLFIMQKFHWPREMQPPFMYATPYEWSMTVDPGDSLIRTVRFAPVGSTGIFYDTIGVVPYNAVNYKNDTLWIYLKGISGSIDTEANIAISTETLSIDSTEINKKSLIEFEIENTGTKIIYIKKLKMEDDFGGVFKLLDKNEEDFQHKIPMQMALVGPNKKRLFYVEFAPKEEKTYEGKVQIECMDDVNKPISNLDKEILVTAIGKQGVSVENYTENENMSLEIIPNPVYDNAKIYYNIKNQSNLELYIIDNLGNKVMNIMSGRLNSGAYIEELNLDKLSSGMYYIVAFNNAEVLKVPLVLIK
jgi:hypothetical protein